MKKTVRLFVLGLTIVLLAGCKSSQGGIQVSNAWSRPGLAGSTTGTFLSIRNSGSQADRLVGVECSSAKSAEIHETTMENDVMRMRPVDAIEIPAGEQVQLKPGGYHIMLIELQHGLQVGDELILTLVFETAGRVEVKAEVRAP